LPGGLADANYRATLSKGSFLANDAALDFFVLAGDANHDRSVNFADLVILARNYSHSPRLFTDGDANYDGRVDFADLMILAGRYGSALLGASSAKAASVAAPATGPQHDKGSEERKTPEILA
jgi:hypothetical protein